MTLGPRPAPSGHIIDTPNLKFVQEFAFSIPQEDLQVFPFSKAEANWVTNTLKKGSMEAIKIHGVQKLKVSNKKRRKTQKNVYWNFGGYGAQNYLKLS